jgi:hypothetical protein
MTCGIRRLVPAALLAGGLVVWGLVAGSGPACAQATPDHIFTIDYSREPIPRGGWAVEGYVNNSSRYLVSGVRLRVQVLDASGQAIGEAFGWVYGNVPAGGRAYFTVSIPRRGDDYRINVVSFTQNSGDAP